MLSIALIAALAVSPTQDSQAVYERALAAVSSNRGCLVEAIRGLPQQTSASAAAPLVRAQCLTQSEVVRQMANASEPDGLGESERAAREGLRTQLRASIFETDEEMVSAIEQSRLQLTSNLLNQPPMLPPAPAQPVAGSYLLGRIFDPLSPTFYLISADRSVPNGRYAVAEMVMVQDDGSIGISGFEYDCEARLSRLVWVRGYDARKTQVREEINTAYPANGQTGPVFDYACSGITDGFEPVRGDPIRALSRH